MPQSIVQPLRRWDPERIGSYTIIGKLGAGAMGQVFLARSSAGRLVAVKTIRIELAEEPGFRARFAREVAAASRVSGVFTAAVIEADADADRPWVATAYVPAPSLSQLVRTAGPLPVPAVRWLAAGCAEALQSIHSAGLLHRDVKPSNVLVAPDGPRVIDFGVARAAERVQLTTTRGASGTPAYMAPEQARDATQASPASDIFSLGATLVYAATGHSPYQGDTIMDILVRLATEPPDLDGVPGELTGLVTACLERVPRDRPSGAAILRQLGQFALPNGPGHVYLPDSAMTVIGEYQRAPLPPPGAAANGDASAGSGGLSAAGLHSGTAGSRVPAAPSDDTSGSHTALPGFPSVSGLYLGQRRAPGRAWPLRRRRRAWQDQRDPETGPRHGATRATGHRPLPLWARVAGVVVLLAAGAGFGLLLRGSGTTTSGGLGPVATPPGGCQQAPAGQPVLCVSQPYGDGDTVFVLHGSGFNPGRPVTITMAGKGVSPDRPLPDQAGSFNYAFDQGHHFFSGPIPTGSYSVTASTAGLPSVSARFRVYPGGQLPPLPTPAGPPAGPPPQ
jgi:serine/threonine protein kinase